MYVIEKKILNDLNVDFSNTKNTVEMPLREIILNNISNNIKFIKATDKKPDNSLEVKLCLCVRNSHKMQTFEGDVYLENAVLRNPFNSGLKGYFTMMYTLQFMLTSKYTYNPELIQETIMHPTALVYSNGVIYVVYTLVVKDDKFRKFNYVGEGELIEISNDTFTPPTELGRIILAKQNNKGDK